MPHLFKHRFVVVDVIHPNDDTRGRKQRLRPAWHVVISGRYIQDILQALKLRQGSGAETNQACKERRPVKLNTLIVIVPLVIKQDVIATTALDEEGWAIKNRGDDQRTVSA